MTLAYFFNVSDPVIIENLNAWSYNLTCFDVLKLAYLLVANINLYTIDWDKPATCMSFWKILV